MLCFKPVPLLLLLPLLLILLSFISPSHGAFHTRYHQQSALHLGRGVLEKSDEFERVSSPEMGMKGRYVLDGSRSRVELVENHTMILAEKRTYRKDLLDHNKHYTGGWNISNKHYFSSAAYPAAPLFLIAVVWFLGFALIMLFVCIHHCCCRLNNYGYSRIAYALSLVLLILFTTASIIGCIVLYTGQEKFHMGTTAALDYVVHQADSVVDNLTIVSGYLNAAKSIGVDQFTLPSNILDNINTVENKINSSATDLRRVTDKNSHRIKKALHIVRATLIAVAAVMLLLVGIGFLLSIYGKQTVVYIMGIIGWILAAIALTLCCVFLVLNNLVGDTCVAMDEWVQFPTAHTALDDILPCVDPATAQQTFSQSKDVTFQLVGVVNLFINNVSNMESPMNLPPGIPRNFRLLFYNQSGPLVPIICNPFNADFTDRTCAAGEIDLSNASQELRKFICKVSSDGACTTPGRLTPDFYDQMMKAINLGYSLHHYGPFLVNLIDCTFVRETFTSIHENNCPDLRRYNKWVFIGLLMVSLAVMLSLIFWVVYARERRHRVYTKQLEDDSPYHHHGEEKSMADRDE